MERGEVDGRCGWSWTSIKITHPDWVTEKRINLLLLMALQKSADIPRVPLVMNLATNPTSSLRARFFDGRASRRSVTHWNYWTGIAQVALSAKIVTKRYVFFT